MATRLNTRTAEQSRSAIQTTQLIKRLQKHADGQVEMSATQVRAAEILLNKTLPNLKGIEHSGDPDNPIVTKIELEVVDPKG